ncbi:MAG: SDR family NAD(P)-dependent oxidoreductase [Ignavibacteria bacterium]|nr:SDR family NAD(P)-dependent oxidoreductase [Ignavibacteria bacterium]
MTFDNKTILITGASTGIGKSLAFQLMTENCNLVLTARRNELLEEIKIQSRIADHRLLLIKSDVSQKVDVMNAFRAAKEKFGKIDVAILNAGVGYNMDVENYTSKYAEEIYGTNLLGIVYWVEQLLPDFLKRGEGMIVGLSSLSDSRGYSRSSFYSSSKAAATNYLEGLRVECKPHGINVITVRPGFVETPMTKKNKFHMPFLMTAEKAAKIIINGLKKEKRMIQFPWQMVFITRFIGLLPRSIYEFLAVKTMNELKKRK